MSKNMGEAYLKNKNMTLDEMIDFFKDKNVPSFFLDKERLKTNSPPLTQEEQLEYAFYSIKIYRSIIANEYLLSCVERFGHGINSTFIFRHDEYVIPIDKEVIETLLQHQIEKLILDESPEEGYLTVQRFYTTNDQREKETGHQWMQRFIDSAFIEIAELINAPVSGDL
ncbi:hypothetical protein ACSNKO_18560, partial [Proteus mirabilis]|uniref:hypothetical protein n=2 Tax=Proteus mirabilis TaxID=584 RepID=UPI003F198C82